MMYSTDKTSTPSGSRESVETSTPSGSSESVEMSTPSGSSERVDIGDEAERWSNFKNEIGAESNETAAKLLLDRYTQV